mgnify:CR=1 FL=1
MKITKSKLKALILEEIQNIEEVDNASVQLATAQSQIEQLNGSGDEQILEDLFNLSQDFAHLLTGLGDKSIQGALMEILGNLQHVINETLMDVVERTQGADIPSRTDYYNTL